MATPAKCSVTYAIVCSGAKVKKPLNYNDLDSSQLDKLQTKLLDDIVDELPSDLFRDYMDDSVDDPLNEYVIECYDDGQLYYLVCCKETRNNVEYYWLEYRTLEIDYLSIVKV